MTPHESSCNNQVIQLHARQSSYRLCRSVSTLLSCSRILKISSSTSLASSTPAVRLATPSCSRKWASVCKAPAKKSPPKKKKIYNVSARQYFTRPTNWTNPTLTFNLDKLQRIPLQLDH